MTKYGIKLVCFDLDKTLIKGNSWSAFNKALGITTREDKYYLNKYLKGKISYSEWTKIFLDLYRERGKASLYNIMKVASRFRYRSKADNVINFLKRKGYRVIIISGAMDVLVNRIAAQLDVEATVTTRFIFDKPGKLMDITVEDDDKNAKLYILKQVTASRNIRLTECACVGDGDNDVNMFTKTKHGITFKGSPIEHKAWKTIKTLNDLKNIL